MKTIEWQIEKRRVSQLAPADYNPRVLTEKARGDLTKSVTKFGQAEPLIVNTNGNVIGGHSRIKVFMDLGIEECDVMVPSRRLSVAEEKELNVRLNKNTGEWDWVKLKEFFNVRELTEYGFGGDELSLFFDKNVQVDEDDFNVEDEVAKIKTPVSKVGDVWMLGSHKIICGDSQLPETFGTLLGEERADMVWTDPPYNVNYNHATKKKRKHEFAGGPTVINDNMTPEDFQAMLLSSFLNIESFLKDQGSIYICHAMGTRETFHAMLLGAGFRHSQTIIWLKERIILSLGQDFHRIYEPIWHGWKEKSAHWKNKNLKVEPDVWDLDRISFEERLDVWFLNRDKSKDYLHPTQKPVRLPERAIKKSAPPGGIVLEPFLGSGSALLACEQLSRVCRGIELDPRYVDAIIKRWQRFTGGTAECLTNPKAKIHNE
jgi:DNA modification methylase